MDIESKLDTDRFGFKIGKTNGDIFADNPSETIKKLEDLGYKLLIARVDFKDIELINKLEEFGFRVKDSQMTYRYQLKDFKGDYIKFDPIDDYVIREYKESDTKKLMSVAKDSFNNYGHYFSNNRLDKEICREIYEDWTYNSCTNKNVADKIFVSEFNGEPIGFLSFKIYEEDGHRYAAGGMGAVNSEHRGKELFPRLVLAGLQWGNDIGLDWEEHNVIVNNIPVNRSFTKMKFKSDNVVVTMHCWLDEN
jgi:hypothetical protein